jgi:NADPH:quinone reductase-like Zn-dependent oxidoreductase
MRQIFQAMLLGPLLSKFGNKQIGNVAAQPSQEDLAFVGDLLHTGKLRPVIDRCYPFSEAPEALLYLGEKHAQGKIVVTVTP